MTETIVAVNEVIDAKQRSRALDPRHSFIVQAPAGSGKTEILTQRFLVLLGRVSVPEEILAITFTKKAAAEMRARLIQTLKKAATLPEPTTAHEKKTWLLAHAALAQDKLLNWNLLENPNRLRVQTIDSFNASLIKFLPVLSHFGAPPDITETPDALYQEAVAEFLTHLEENVDWSDAIAQLLVHMDNDLNKLTLLLVNMLKKRDQWLPYLVTESENPDLRQQLETSLALIVIETLTAVQASFPRELAEELLFIARYAASNLKLANNLDSFILHCLDIGTIPTPEIQHKNAWLGICELLLTKDNEWRKRCDVNMGFPAPSSAKNKAEKILYQDMKERHETLTAKLFENTILHSALTKLRKAPDETYQENQWQTLHALYKVLRVVVAQLNVVFRRYGKIDYIENSQAALYALGADEHPTDLALTLDYQIKHILIDEFQDTSNSQYRLIQKLTAGWQPNDGRTLFVVGDPMQSIYRFREAEVGLFIRARKEGIGHVKLEPLTLSVNFRSTSTIVDWINLRFQKILPPVEDLATGAVAYSHSKAFHDTEIDTQVKTHALTSFSPETQAEVIVELIQKRKQEKPLETIAILVRARSHLEYIIPALKKANLNYRAIKIDALNSRPVIQDLIALTKALNDTADRVAWLAVLRAPWCGLSLADMLELTGDYPPKTIPECLHLSHNTLSADGQTRLARVSSVLLMKILERQRHSLSYWVESTWLALGGAACLEQETDLEDIKAYLQLLEKLDNSGNIAQLDKEVSQLFAATNTAADNSLQIMTIHNAKGLEFDTVILPHLEKQAPHDSKQILLWMEKQWHDSPNSLLLAPVNAIGADSDAVYNYIKDQHATKNDHELGRLLYVAATRAKKHLHLFLTHAREKFEESLTEVKGKSLLKKLLPALGHELTLLDNNDLENKSEIRKQVFIKRLPSSWCNNIHEIPSDPITRHQTMPGFSLTQDHYRKVGILIHKILENICRFGSDWWQLLRTNEYLTAHLLQAGINQDGLDQAITKINSAVTNTLQDPRGQWILQSHSKSQTELQLTAVIDGEVTPLIIDRTFIDDSGIRWIIDYKSSHHEETTLEDFLQNEYEEYAKKMQMYHNALTFLGENSIKLGLYFPLIPAWKEWQIS